MQLINIIGVVSVFVLLLLAGFLTTVKTHNKLSNRLFAVFLILTALNLSGWFLWILLPGSEELKMFRVTFSFLDMPIFYLYVLSVCYQDFKLKLNHWLHAIPFILTNIILISEFYSQFVKNSFSLSEIQFISVATEIQWVLYIIAVVYTLNRFRRIYLENYTDTSIQSFKWLFQLTLVFIVAHTLTIFKSIVAYTSYDWAFDWIQIFVGFSALSISCWFVLKALYSPELFRGVDSNLQTVENLIQQKELFEESSQNIVVDAVENPETERLIKYMEQEKPYLDSSLTLQKLAEQVEISSRDLSILINHDLGQHFFDFVNAYRVEEAAEMLENKEKSNLTILEILYEVGFNSKSSFNTAFKKHTNLTPTQYRRNHSL